MGKLTHTVSGNPVSFKSADKSNIESLKVYFDPIQMGTGNASPSNIKPIYGWTSINCFQTSEIIPIIPINFTPIELNGGTLNYLDKSTFFISGTLTSNTTFSIPIESFTLKKNKTYNKVIIIEAQGAYVGGILSAGISFKYNDSSFFSLTLTPLSQPINVWNHSSDWTREDQDVNAFNIILRTGWSNVKVKFLLTENPINEDIVQFDQTVYGGYIDLITGTLVQTHAKFIEDGSESESVWGKTSRSNFIAYERTDLSTLGALQPYIGYKTGWFNYCSSPLTGQVWEGAIGTGGNYPNNNLRLLVPTSFSTTSSLLAYFAENPLEVVYELQTPIIYQLTPQQMKTILGQNNIWSNVNGNIEVIYDFIDHMAKRRLELNTPHIETLSSSLITFNTDMQAPLKKAKFYFTPIQTGSGDPGPTNIRSIGNYSNISICHTGKNLININDTLEKRTDYNIIGFNNHLLPNTTYTFSINGTTNYTYGLGSKTPSDQTSLQSVALTETFPQSGEYETFTTPNIIYDKLYLMGSYGGGLEDLNNVLPQIEVGTIKTNYEAYNGEVINVNCEEAYRGYIDLVNNQLVNESISRLLPYGNNAKGVVTSNSGLGMIVYDKRTIFGSLDAIDINGPLLTSVFKLITTPNPIKNVTTPWVCFFYNTYIAFVGDTTLTTKEAWTNFIIEMNNVQIVGKATTPTIYNLNYQPFKTFKGINNIWSSANGTVDIKYWTH